MSNIIRKCDECKKEIEINESTLEDIIYYNKKYYHTNCFISMCNRKKKNKRYSKKWRLVLDNIDEIKKESIIFCKNIFYKNLIYDFILNNYDIKVIPNRIFTKLDSFYNGTYKGMSVPMNPEDLYDMWQKKMSFLNRLNAKNIQQGKKISGADRINYDLSVLLNKYDSYLEWKEKEKIKAQEMIEMQNNFSEYTSAKSIIASIKNNNYQNDESEDIDKLLDEIFD